MEIKSITPSLISGGNKHIKTKSQIGIPADKVKDVVTQKPSASLLQAVYGVKPQKMGVAKPTPVPFSTSDVLKSLYQAKALLSIKDFKNIKRVLNKGDEQTANVMMQLELIKSGDIEPSTLSNYWETGKMNNNLANDLDMVYEARRSGKNVADVYVPNVKSVEDGNNQTKIGDVFKVENQDKIYIKTDDNSSKQLDMDKETFIKLFPPAKRFTTQQQSIGDCYLVTSLETVMNNPKARVALYDAFHQKGDDVVVKFKNGYGEYLYKDAKLPQDRVKKYSLKGAEGIKILEDAYGLDSVNKSDVKFREIQGQKIAQKQKEFNNAPMNKKAEILKSLNDHKKRLDDYLKAKEKFGDDIVVCRDDNFYNIYYEEDDAGLVFSRLDLDHDNRYGEYKSAADFYRGALGGYEFEVLERLGFGGFRQMNLDFEADDVKQKITQDNFNENYIMTGGTRANGDRVENPVAEASGIFGFHAYMLEPQKDENGNLKIRCTNPWNTSYDSDISYEDFLKYYDSVSIIDVNSYGKKLPLKEQPLKYGKNGAIIGENSDDTPVIWYNNNLKKLK